ncbi:hypothetical protein Lal_00022692, partial [Lupinus albus]
MREGCVGFKENMRYDHIPKVGLEEHHRIKFWEDLEKLVHTIHFGENIFLGGNHNEHVWRDIIGFEGANMEDSTILDISSTFDFIIANTCFKKRDEHCITYKHSFENRAVPAGSTGKPVNRTPNRY